jgi:ATP adenylyltransferase/5',5'''-P-1,P-4-tetraphosphate phosphorylase II
MKNILLLTVFLVLSLGLMAQKTSKNQKVKVYYFHATQRCHTCNEIERLAKETVEVKFANELKNNIVSYDAVDYENKDNKVLLDKYEIYGSTLLVVRTGKKEQKSDLTNMAFQYALSKPDKLQEELAKEIAKMILKR